MSALDDYTRSKGFLVCVDSDGCAMDTMNIKHIRCFGPCMVSEWRLEPWRESILKRWNEINLYSGTRGVNRFKALAMMLGEVSARYTHIDGIAALTDWVQAADELSNASLARKQGDHPIFGKALRWSEAVNRAIAALPKADIKPFAHVREALAKAHGLANVAVVSSANPEAVREEWERFGLLESVDLLCTQDLGSKSYCISRLLEKGYQAEQLLMCGDAPGDEQAAAANGVLFYPIQVGREAECWRQFANDALQRFLTGTYAGAYQQSLRAAFAANLHTKRG